MMKKVVPSECYIFQWDGMREQLGASSLFTLKAIPKYCSRQNTDISAHCYYMNGSFFNIKVKVTHCRMDLEPPCIGQQRLKVGVLSFTTCISLKGYPEGNPFTAG